MLRAAVLIALVLAPTAGGAGEPYLMVLGVAQDGGYPQAGTKDHPAWDNPGLRRSVSCVAVVDPDDGGRWLLDITPDFKAQLRRLDVAAPHPETPGLRGIFLTHAHTGHYTGLLHLGHEMMGASEAPVWAMPRMYAFLSTQLPWRDLIERRNIRLQPLQAGEPVQLNERLTLTPILVPHRDEYSETVAFRIRGPERSALYLPDIDKWERWDASTRAGEIERQIAEVDLAFIDGSFYADGEIPGRDMSQIPHPFISESMQRFSTLPAGERSKVRFIHLNRTNPAIHVGSPQRAEIESGGFGVADEGHKHPL